MKCVTDWGLQLFTEAMLDLVCSSGHFVSVSVIYSTAGITNYCLSCCYSLEASDVSNGKVHLKCICTLAPSFNRSIKSREL